MAQEEAVCEPTRRSRSMTGIVETMLQLVLRLARHARTLTFRASMGRL